ncbi:hypothetical protein HDU98_002382, partial [Podochytrium sp. JEL0797]
MSEWADFGNALGTGTAPTGEARTSNSMQSRGSGDSFASFASYEDGRIVEAERIGLTSRRGSSSAAAEQHQQQQQQQHHAFDEYLDTNDAVFLIPLSTTLLRATRTDREQGASASTRRDISLFTGIGLILALAIGSGIYASPGPVLIRSGSGIAALLVWLCAGVLVLAGSTLIWLLTSLHISSNRLGTLVQDIFTVLKLLSLIFISGCGFVYLYDHPEYHDAHNFSQAAWGRTSTRLGDYAIAFYSALWAYDG